MNNYLESIFSLKNKTALITGGSRGIGAGIVSAFLDAGANVVCLSRSDPIAQDQPNFSYYQCNVSDSERFKSICKLIDSRYNGIDILVNAAGIVILILYFITSPYQNCLRIPKTLSHKCIEYTNW